ncbi:MAG: hypothetical protein H5T68_04725 [Chloroflexi bacterium]|nr:hypothetical protein [Chloroflexota bacterium]
MGGIYEIFREALPEIIAGLVVAAILALVGVAVRKRANKVASSHQNVPPSSPLPCTKPQSKKKENAELLDLKHRRLHELQKKKALMGINTPPEVMIEIEELEKDIHELERIDRNGYGRNGERSTRAQGAH